MGLLGKTLLVLVLGLVIHRAARIVWTWGFLKTVYDHSPGPCHIVEGIDHGSEDIQQLSNGLALISSGLKMGRDGDEKIEGAIYLFDFNNPKAGVSKVQIVGHHIENPHGISVWEDPKTDEVTVFIVNHAKEGERVEKLEFDKSTKVLTHVESISDPNFIWLNDVVAAGPETFYTTNHNAFEHPLMKLIELFFTLHYGTVVYYNGIRGHIIADNFGGANGINLSPDGRFLYVASVFDKTIDIFHRSPDSNIQFKQIYPIHTMPDNIDVCKDTGDLWIGAHPKMSELFSHFMNTTAPAPSQVLRLQMKEGNVTAVEEVFADSGKRLYGSSIASYHKGSVLIGTILHKLMYCEVLHMA